MVVNFHINQDKLLPHIPVSGFKFFALPLHISNI